MRFVIVIITLFLELSSEAKVAIKGRILNYDGTSYVFVNYPIQGVRPPDSKKIFPDSNGNFFISFECKGPGVTKILYKTIRFNVFHIDNAAAYLEIDERRIPDRIENLHLNYVQQDSIRNLALTKVSGDFEKLNRHYNSLIRTAYHTPRSVDGNYYSRQLRNAETLKQTMLLFDSLIQREMSALENIFLEFNSELRSSKSDVIKQFLKNEINSFYSSVFLNAMFLRKVDQYVAFKADSLSPRSIYNEQWQALIEKFYSDAKGFIQPFTTSFDYTDYMENLYYTLKNFKSYDFPQNPDVKELDLEVYQSFFKVDSTIIRDSLELFQFRLNKLHRYLNDQMYYSPALLSAYYVMVKTYPASIHLREMELLVQKLKDYIKASQETFTKVKIVSKKYSSFQDLVQSNRGTLMLIDVWATWCHPCIEEFHYRYKIQSFIDAGKLVVLYISLDKKEWASRWKENIRFNRLEGIHYRADQDFAIDMWRELQGKQGTIPRYALVNKRGDIVLLNASRPSDGDKLVKEIERLIVE